jgi:hypothetical protein
MGQSSAADQCCPEFSPDLWNDKSHNWKAKKFIRDEVVQLMHIPLNMGQVVTRMMAKIDASGARPNNTEFLMLCHDPSPWKSEIYMTVTKPVKNAQMAEISGKFLTRVYDGPYNAVPGWIKDMDKYVSQKGESVKKYYFHYAYCPKCSKKYGHNYVIAFAQVG